MTRTLPWLKGTSSTSNTTTSTSRAPIRGRAPKRRRLGSTSPDSDDDLNTTGVSTPSRRRLLKGIRTPSTSPPPAPSDLQLMREGYAEDDIWMLVEDEFLATAQTFTQHLHHAEYQRLKAVATKREQENRAILRPVDKTSRISAEGSISLHREQRQRSMKEVMGKAAEKGQTSDREDQDPWVGTELAGLMESPRKARQIRAKGMGSGRSNTRAAAGFSKASGSDAEKHRHATMQLSSDDAMGMRSTHRTKATDEPRNTTDILDASHKGHHLDSIASRQDVTFTFDEDDDLNAIGPPARRSPYEATPKNNNEASLVSGTARLAGGGENGKQSQRCAAFHARSSTFTQGAALPLNRNDYAAGLEDDRASAHQTNLLKSEDHYLGLPAPILKSQKASTGGGGFLARRRAERERARREQEQRATDGEEGALTTAVPTADIPPYLF